jgi:hypothetical protein
MPERKVSAEVAGAISVLAVACASAMYTAIQSTLATDRTLAACIEDPRPSVAAAQAALRAAILHDIAAATTASAEAELAAAVIDARKACAETLAILEPAVVALADAQDVHRDASGAYSRAYDGLQAALQLMSAGPVG